MRNCKCTLYKSVRNKKKNVGMMINAGANEKN